MEAGSDTTASTLLSFIMALLNNPAILKKAQQEIDSKCGSDKCPGMNDSREFEYLRACMNEVSRKP
jgi:cytochrome P450